MTTNMSLFGEVYDSEVATTFLYGRRPPYSKGKEYLGQHGFGPYWIPPRKKRDRPERVDPGSSQPTPPTGPAAQTIVHTIVDSILAGLVIGASVALIGLAVLSPIPGDEIIAVSASAPLINSAWPALALVAA